MEYAVVEICNSRCVGYHPVGDEYEAQKVFEDVVREYGVEPYAELNGLFETDDGYVVELLKGERAL